MRTDEHVWAHNYLYSFVHSSRSAPRADRFLLMRTHSTIAVTGATFRREERAPAVAGGMWSPACAAPPAILPGLPRASGCVCAPPVAPLHRVSRLHLPVEGARLRCVCRKMRLCFLRILCALALISDAERGSLRGSSLPVPCAPLEHQPAARSEGGAQSAARRRRPLQVTFFRPASRFSL